LFEANLSTVHVAQMLSRLPESERALFSLRYFQGFNATELGEMFGLPSSTVRARLLSARKILQQLLKDE
jgi:RNA polymerase sigma-70 factor (ECF subfamily)